MEMVSKLGEIVLCFFGSIWSIFIGILMEFDRGIDPQEWSEQEMGRDMWPSFAGMLELGALKRIYSLQRIHKEPAYLKWHLAFFFGSNWHLLYSY